MLFPPLHNVFVVWIAAQARSASMLGGPSCRMLHVSPHVKLRDGISVSDMYAMVGIRLLSPGKCKSVKCGEFW